MIDPELPTTVENQPAVLCSFAECPSGHKWRLQLLTTKCNGCGCDIVARRLSNCIVCNEPPVKMEIRVDHLATGMAVMPVCKGSSRTGQIDIIVLNREILPFEQEFNEGQCLNK